MNFLKFYYLLSNGVKIQININNFTNYNKNKHMQISCVAPLCCSAFKKLDTSNPLSTELMMLTIARTSDVGW
jgi:hypothetical protein